MTNRSNDPLFGEIPESVPLLGAPLVRVLALVQFSKISKISDERYIADFQEALRSNYPHVQAEKVKSVEIRVSDDEIHHEAVETTVWRFLDPNKTVRVSLATDFIGIETANYVSRADFLGKMHTVLEAFSNSMKPPLVERVGFRYVDRLEGEDCMGALADLIQADLLNVLRPNLAEHIEISMTEVVGRTAEGKLIARYGLAPKGFSHDPAMAPPVGEPSWVLDVDSFSTNCAGNQLEPDFLYGELDKVAARAYAFFRWSITDKFLTRFKDG
ncbi:TIGR04255 family protein [Yoonia tamlensis]|uniref:TIGR04255 family protein n=1 Tax=Yoonia tamlensis TaxID=390270 RepID=A0A1I6GDU0_9RHOB|nr:TIGR04255 family protein [Yoonia tamlensis]SFR40383.1 TIGR04255 family protein [Yoonia tamlensis]